MNPSALQLSSVHWFSKMDDECVLKKLGVPYGFQGKGFADLRCHSVHQVHGTKIVEAGPATEVMSPERPHADGLYSQQAGLMIGVQTADCLPILLVTEHKTTAMALHAGWRGLTAGLVTKGVKTLRDLQPNSAIFALVGPAIGPCHYEVGPEFVDAISGPILGLTQEQASLCLSPGQGDRSFLNLASAAVFALLNSHVRTECISVFRSCTYRDANLWHSFRRDKENSGRNWTWIAAS